MDKSRGGDVNMAGPRDFGFKNKTQHPQPFKYGS